MLKAVEIGCDGYILKDSDSKLLKKAINSICEGNSYITTKLNTGPKRRVANKTTVNSKLGDLTRREIEVLKLLAEGLFNKEIAVKLQISRERTVKNHVFEHISENRSFRPNTGQRSLLLKNGLVSINYKTSRNVSRETFLVSF